MYSKNETDHVSMFEDTAIGTVSRFLIRNDAADVRIQRKDGEPVRIPGSTIFEAMAAGLAGEPLRTLIATVH